MAPSQNTSYMVVADGDYRRTPLSSKASLFVQGTPLSSKASRFVPCSSAWAACEPHDSLKVSRQTISLLEGLPEESNPSDNLNVARKTVSLVEGLPEEPRSVSLAQGVPESTKPEQTVSLLEGLPEGPWTVCLAQGVPESTTPEKTVSLVKGLPEGPWRVCLAQGSPESTNCSEPSEPSEPSDPSECGLQETLCREADTFVDASQSDPVKVHSLLSFENDLHNLVADSNEISQAPQYSRELLLSLRCLCPGKDMALNATGANIHTCRDRSDFVDDVQTPVVLGPCNGKPEDSIKSTHYEANEILHPELHDKTLSAKPQVKSTMSTHLNNLAVADSARVLTLRKLNRLGMDSSAALETYFSRFGTVESVMVSHTFVKSMFAKGKKRERPATTGFVMMGKAEDAQAVLAAGADHEVQGATITVLPFKSHSLDAAEVEPDSVKSE